MRYSFDWDIHKAAVNRRKYGVGFRRASTVFLDPNAITIFDQKHSNTKEDRWLTLGIDNTGIVLVVSHTFKQIDKQTGEIRIISARKATRKEKTIMCDELEAEYDFSKGERGKFYHPDVTLHIPVYLEPDVESFLQALAEKRDSDVQDLVNEIIRKHKQLVESLS